MIQRIIDRVKESEYIKNIAVVFTGTTIAQTVPILLSPFLTRLYSPGDFGVYAFAMSVGVCVAAIAASQYNHGIMLEKENHDAKQVVLLSFIISTLLSLITFIGVSIFVFGVRVFPTFESIKGASVLLPLYVFFTGINHSFFIWNNRNKRYKVISMGRAISAIATAFSQIILAFIFQVTPLLLLIGLVFGQFCSLLYLFSSTSDLHKGLLDDSTFVKIKLLGIKHKNFLIYTSFCDLMTVILWQFPVFVLTRLAGATLTGQFALSNKLLAMPSSFISSSVGEVFCKRAIDEYNQNGSCFRIFSKTFKGLFLLSVIPFLVLFIFAPDIFALVFGEAWRESGVFARIMTPAFFFRFTVSPLCYIFYIRGKQREDFIARILTLVLIASCFFFGHFWFENINIVLLMYSFILAGMYTYYLVRAYFLAKNRT